MLLQNVLHPQYVYHNVPSSRPLFQWLKNEQDKRDGSYKQAGAARGFSWQTL